MAARESYASDRRQSGGYSSARSKAGQAYMYGNVVAKPEYEPKKNRSSVKRRKKVSRQVQKNRNRALHMNAAYVVFLAIAATIVLLLCVNYVRLQSELTKHSKNVTALQEELADLKEENTTKYNAVVDSVNLDEIREKAINQLGMTYATPDQIVEYDNPASDYVKQYENIPENGVLAQSDKNKKLVGLWQERRQISLRKKFQALCRKS